MIEALLATPPGGITMELLLEKLGRAAGVTRVLVFENQTNQTAKPAFTLRLAWLAPGTRLRADSAELQKPFWIETGFKRWLQALGQGLPIQGWVRDFPEAQQNLLAARNIISVAAAPINSGPKWRGILQLDDCQHRRPWSPEQIEALSFAAHVIGAAIVRDQAEKALVESEKKYRRLFENESDAVMIFDAQSLRFEDANPVALDLFGYDEEAFLCLTLEEISDEIDETRAAVQRVIHDRPGNEKISLRRFRRKDGSTFPGKIAASKFFAAGQMKIIGKVRDITDRIQTEEKIHTLTQELIKAQENERHRLARYLHDQVAQDLSSLKIGCETLFDDPEKIPPATRKKITEFSKILQQSIMAVRDLSYDLRPAGMDQLGLVRTVFQYCADFSAKSGLPIDFFSAGIQDLTLDFDTEINIFRLIQEGLNNIRQHAAASRAVVRLVASSPEIILRIEDNGRGFDVEKRRSSLTREKRMGLTSMEERVMLLGGSMKIESCPAKGTKILIKVPLREKNSAAKKHLDYR